MVVAKR